MRYLFSGRSKTSLSLSEKRDLSGLLLPAVLVVLAFVLIPVLGTFRDSLYLNVTFLPHKFTGWENYKLLLQDSAFHQSLLFTSLFALVSAPLEVALGLLVALVVHESFPGRGLLRAAVLLPWAIPATVSGKLFQLIYNYNYGMANYLLKLAGMDAVNWLATPASAFFSLVAADAWKTTPFAAILILAALSSIPEELYDQAKVDRAGIGRRFLFLTLPLLKPILLVILLFRAIEAFRVFDLIFVLTGGGPGGWTTSLSMLGYRYFAGGDFGYGSAISVILFLIALVLTLVYLRMGRPGEGQGGEK